MNRAQLAAAFRKHFADNGVCLPGPLLAALLLSSGEYAAHEIERCARPPVRERLLAGAR